MKGEGFLLRYILLVDMNCFYVSVERAENHKLKGEVCAVAGSEAKRNGVILTASYEARKFGIKAGMSNREALSRCPNLKLIPPHHDLYEIYSMSVMDILREFIYKLEQTSIDEAYLDVSEYCNSYEEAEILANKIKNAIYERLNITVSIGISYNKVLSKLSSDIAEYNSIYTIKRNELSKKVWSLPISCLCGVGKRTEEKLHMLNIFTIGELAKSDPKLIKSVLKKPGEILWKHSNGIDNSEVNHIKTLPKSIGHSKTSIENITSYVEAYKLLENLCMDVVKRMNKYYATGATIVVTIKTNDLNSFSRQKTRFNTTCSQKIIFEESKLLLNKNWNEDKPIRMLGVTISNLKYYEEQLSFNI